MIIDMQTAFTRMEGDDAWEEDHLGRAIARIQMLADEAQAEGRKVIVVRQVFQGWYTNFMIKLTAKGRGAAGSEGLELDLSLAIDADLDVEKPLGDSFSAKALDRFLATHRIGALQLTGLDGNFCVKATARGALGRGYDVILNDDAILAQDHAAWAKEKTALTAKGARLASTA